MSKIKIAVVDDELTSRNTLKGYLENNTEYEIVADFQSGKSALEWLRKNSVDILLCDMKMPEMNGVELMWNIHVVAPYLPVIVISGFDDFNYVRSSLVNEAANYLLKSELTAQSLIAALDQVRDRYRIVPKSSGIHKKRGFCITDPSAFTAENIRRMTDAQKIDFHCTNVVPIAISPDFKFFDGMNFAEYRSDIVRAMQDMIAQMLQEQYPYLLHITKKRHILLLISFVKMSSALYILNILHNFISRFQRQSLRMLDATVTIISGENHAQLEQAMDEMFRLEDLLEDKLYLGGNRIASATVTKKLVYEKEELPAGLWEQLAFELENGMPEALGTMQDMLERMERSRYDAGQVYKNCRRISKLMMQAGLLTGQERQGVLDRLQEYEEFEQFRTELLELYHRKAPDVKKERLRSCTSPRVAQVIDYMEKNYASDISLEVCAAMVGSSYTYLSKEFKKETGMRFVEYLNRIRVRRAKSLLIRSEESMKRIAELSGFPNYNYFFKVFREVEGMSPSEFLSKK